MVLMKLNTSMSISLKVEANAFIHKVYEEEDQSLNRALGLKC